MKVTNALLLVLVVLIGGLWWRLESGEVGKQNAEAVVEHVRDSMHEQRKASEKIRKAREKNKLATLEELDTPCQLVVFGAFGTSSDAIRLQTERALLCKAALSGLTRSNAKRLSYCVAAAGAKNAAEIIASYKECFSKMNLSYPF